MSGRAVELQGRVAETVTDTIERDPRGLESPALAGLTSTVAKVPGSESRHPLAAQARGLLASILGGDGGGDRLALYDPELREGDREDRKRTARNSSL